MSAQRILDSIDKSQRRQAALPEFRPGDSIKVWAKIREGEKTRLQAFEGVCIRRVSKGARSTFTVRKISYGVGVERIFPDNSPNIDKVEVIQRGRVHQSRRTASDAGLLLSAVTTLPAPSPPAIP